MRYTRNARTALIVYLAVTSAQEWSRKMTVSEFETLAEQEATEVVKWRFSQLTRSGFSLEDAIALATRIDVDLHRAADLKSAIDELPDLQRTVITMRDVAGCDSEEVCRALEISEGNQRVLLHRARSRVRKALERHLDV